MEKRRSVTCHDQRGKKNRKEERKRKEKEREDSINNNRTFTVGEEIELRNDLLLVIAEGKRKLGAVKR